MKIIDAHIHYSTGHSHFNTLAKAAGHENTEAHLREVYAKEGIALAIVMSNLNRDPDVQSNPDFLRYCAGVHHDALHPDRVNDALELTERHLRNDICVGLKIYAGYTPYNLRDQVYAPYYELALKYDKPVAVHMGVTANPRGLLRFSHPLQMDDVAVMYPGIQFVMCHFGNPWLMDAAAVLEKNPNVSADMSGLIAGNFDTDAFLRLQHGYVEQLKTWITYVEDYEKFMFGTDWPLTNISEYIRLFERIIPEKYHELFFFENAKRIYKLDV